MLVIDADPDDPAEYLTVQSTAQRARRGARTGIVHALACGLMLVCLALSVATDALAQNDPPAICVPNLDALTQLSPNRTMAELPLLEALTGLSVLRESTSAEGEHRYSFSISRAGTPLLEVIPDASGSPYAVVIHDARTAPGLGYALGDTHARWRLSAADAECNPGEEELSGSVLCSTPRRPAWLLRFDGAWQGPDGNLPPPDVLASWTLSEVIWLIGSEQPGQAPVH